MSSLQSKIHSIQDVPGQVRAWLAAQGPVFLVCTAMLCAGALAFSGAAYIGHGRGDVPPALRQAQAQAASNASYAALMTLHGYGLTIDERLDLLPDLLLQDQMRALHHRLMTGMYRAQAHRTYPAWVREHMPPVLHPEALMLTGELLLQDRHEILQAHAHALARDEPRTLDWETMERLAAYLPRATFSVASQMDPDNLERARAIAERTLSAARLESPPALGVRLYPYFDALRTAGPPGAASDKLQELASDEGGQLLVSLLADPALDVLRAVERAPQDDAREAFEHFIRQHHPREARVTLARALAARLGLPLPAR